MGTEIGMALLSVWDKTGIVDFAKALSEMGTKLISTGGTMRAIKDAGVEVHSVSEITQFPEILDGRVKTLHPNIHSGILARRDLKEHMDEIGKHGIGTVDLVAVNLYPFEQTIAKPDCTLEDAIENIDIGGPSMIRAAAKNYEGVVVVCNPSWYPKIIEELKAGGKVSIETRRALMYEAFKHTSAYDAVIETYLAKKFELEADFPPLLNLKAKKMMDLRYGENPHQGAAFYIDPVKLEACVAFGEVLHGKKLSFNNYLDMDGALELAKEWDEPTAVVVKHTNPCGVAVRSTISEAYKMAHAVDPKAAFGGVVGLNRPVDKDTAVQIKSTFIEAVAAPDFEEDALAVLQKKKNIRLVRVGNIDTGVEREKYDIKKIVGGVLVQDRDRGKLKPEDLKIVTKKKPTDQDIQDLLFARTVVKHVKSNSVVFARDMVTTGVGAGQMARVDSVNIACWKGGDRIKGSVMASDAFFPFRDAVDDAAKNGVVAIIQPGGSVRDQESIDAADEHGIAMVFSGMRSFKH